MADPQPHSSITTEIQEEQESTTTTQFPQFDIVTDYSDHHYATENPLIPTVSRQVRKRIKKEWKRLEKGLPDTIYVRVYERRIDILRAVIVGSAGTPCHDGLFFFDLAFPADYPNKPPLVYYHSFALRILPNFYDSCIICLSSQPNLLVGEEPKRWNPNESTILQLLVSLQGLILNERFFKEPRMIPSKVKKSLVYYHSKGFFEGFISRHFNERGTHILTACDDYINGRAGVGMIDVENVSDPIKVSKRFKKTLVPLFQELVVRFAKNGTPVVDLLEEMKKKREMESVSSITEVKKEKSVWFKGCKVLKENRFVNSKIKKFLGLKKDGGGKEGNGEVNKRVKVKQD